MSRVLHHGQVGIAASSAEHSSSFAQNFSAIGYEAAHPRSPVTSFFLDCSVGAGLPEGASPPVYCAKRGQCDSYAEECALIRRALDRRQFVSKTLCSLPFPFVQYLFGKESIIHVTDGDVYLRCCIKGKPGEEKSKCELMFPKQPPPPKPPPPPAQPIPKGRWKRIKWAVVQVAKFMKGKLLDLLGLGPCGLKHCDPFGEFPPPICLRTTRGGTLDDECLYWGQAGELFPEYPVKGVLDYKVFQFAMPHPCVEVQMLLGGTINSVTPKTNPPPVPAASLNNKKLQTQLRSRRPRCPGDFL